MKLTFDVPFRDIDAMGHMNNVAFVSWLEWARQKYWLALRESRDFRDVDFIVARVEIDYRSQVSLGETLTIDVHIPRLGTSSFDFTYVLTGSDGRLVAEAKTTQVLYDWTRKIKIAIPDERRERIRVFEASTTGR